MSEISGSSDDVSALISYTRSGEIGQSASSISDQEYDLLDFLGVAQSLNIDLLPSTWQPTLDAVGKGGTAEIRQALINVQTSFAFKHFKHPNSAEQESQKWRALIAEISVLGNPTIRNHPNVVDIEGVCWDTVDGGEKVWPVLVFEKTQFRDLDRFMKSGRGKELDSKSRLDMLFDVALAVRDLHATGRYLNPSSGDITEWKEGVIHGDIKPENVLVFSEDDGAYVAKVTDFGYSTLFITESDLITMPKSSPWTAPERHHRAIWPEEAKKMDAYSFGMLCLWLLFYNRAANRDRNFERSWKDPQKKLLHHTSEMLEATADLETWEKQHMQRAFTLTLAQDPDKRTASFTDLLELLSPQRSVYFLSLK